MVWNNGTLQTLDEICHLDAGAGDVITLVARLGACALDSLLDGVGGDDAEQNRNTGGQGNLCNALCALVANQIVVSPIVNSPMTTSTTRMTSQTTVMLILSTRPTPFFCYLSPKIRTLPRRTSDYYSTILYHNYQ